MNQGGSVVVMNLHDMSNGPGLSEKLDFAYIVQGDSIVHFVLWRLDFRNPVCLIIN